MIQICREIPDLTSVGTIPMLLLLLLGWILFRWHRFGFAMLSMCTALGILGGEQLQLRIGETAAWQVRSCLRPARLRAYYDGRVERVVSQGRGMTTMVISGELDAVGLPCVRTSFFVREYTHPRQPVPQQGQRRRGTGWVRRTIPANLDGEFSEQGFAHSLACALVVENAQLHASGPPPWMDATVDTIRGWIKERLTIRLDAQSAAIAMALLVGDRSMISSEAKQAYRLSGTAHIFCVSGSHVAIITTLLLLILGRRPSILMLICTCMLIALYTVIAGSELPAVRSAIMGIVALVGFRTERDVDPMNVLIVSVFFILVVDPTAILSGGFLLSVSATASLITLVPALQRVFSMLVITKRSWKNMLIGSVAVSCAATVGVALPGALAFESVSLWSPIANLLVVPILSGGLLLALGVVIAPMSPLSEAFAWWFTLAVRCADAIAQFFAVDVMEGLDHTAAIALAASCSSVILWLLFARSWRGLLVRLALGAMALAAVMHLHQKPEHGDRILERRYGIVVLNHNDHRNRIVIIGQRNAVIDRPLLDWACRQPNADIIGLGVWGRRMEAHILARKGIPKQWSP